MKLQPRCKFCGEEMNLVDEESRRWYCSKNDVNFMAKAGGWSKGDKEPSTGTAFVKTARAKSVGTALVMNLIPGAGVVYAGSWMGVIYPVLAIVCIFIFAPVYVYAILVVIGSFAHTILAVDKYNSHLRIQNSAAFASLKFRIPAQELTCTNCGVGHREGSRYCRRCGIELPSKSVGSSETRVY